MRTLTHTHTQTQTHTRILGRNLQIRILSLAQHEIKAVVTRQRLKYRENGSVDGRMQSGAQGNAAVVELEHNAMK